jgi:2-amino-4-hydroxy-6-hydroxymethyldihydropteridine diphosphokinase
VAIGSNLGDRRAALEFAARELMTLLDDCRLSEAVETEPEGAGTAEQPLYLNAVAVGWSDRPARELLEALLAIERAFGRTRPAPLAPRTLDLDLVLAGDDELDEPGLSVPHPRFRDRVFVLGPLTEVAGSMVDPVTRLTAAQLLRRLLRDPTR